MLFRLIWTVLPYAVLAVCTLCSLVGVIASFEEDQVAPVEVGVQSLLGDSVDGNVKWVSVSDGFLCWEQSYEIFKMKLGTIKEVEYVLVPYVDRRLYNAFTTDSLSTQDVTESCVLVRFEREKLREEFPDYFVAQENLLRNSFPYSMSFTYDRDHIAFGNEKKPIEQFKDLGFKRVCVAKPGSRPMTRTESLATASVCFLIAIGSVFWIRNRWATARKSKLANQLADVANQGFQDGMRKALQASIQEGVASAIDKLR
jgi:hypothetical protein